MIIEEPELWDIKLVLKIVCHFQFCLLSLFLDWKIEFQREEQTAWELFHNVFPTGNHAPEQTAFSVVVKLNLHYHHWVPLIQATKLFFFFFPKPSNQSNACKMYWFKNGNYQMRVCSGNFVFLKGQLFSHRASIAMCVAVTDRPPRDPIKVQK